MGGLFAATAQLNAFTAVTSGAWSSPATWGGVGPGSTVTNQDIIIPSGIAVDLDMDVAFSGLLNTITVDGALNSTTNRGVTITSGSFQGSGTAMIGKLDLNGITVTYNFSGELTVGTLRNGGVAIAVDSSVTVTDTLNLDQGSVILNTGGELIIPGNSNIIVNNGSITVAGGMFTTLSPYDIWYIGGTKNTGVETNSTYVRDVHVDLSSNSMNLILTANVTVFQNLHMNSGHVVLNGYRLRVYGDLQRGAGAVFEGTGTSEFWLTPTTVGSPTSSIEFTTGSSVTELAISMADTFGTCILDGELLVTGTLRLLQGNLNIDLAANLMLGPGSTVSVTRGRLDQDGLFSVTAGTYNVEYIGPAYIAGPELMTSNLNNLTMDLFLPQQILEVDQDITVQGALTLTQGTFYLDSNTVIVNGDIDQSSSATIRGNMYASELHLISPTFTSDTIWPATFGPGFYNVVLDIPVTSTLYVANGMYVHNNLDLRGGKLAIVNNSGLTIGSNGTITNANDTNYILATNGVLRRLVLVDSMYVPFPIGTAQHYAPIALLSSAPAQQAWFSVGVMDGVWTNGTTGTDVSAAQSVVNKTWMVDVDTAAVYNMGLRTSWVLGSEVNGFNRGACFVKHYDNNMWDSHTPGAAGTGPANTFNAWRGSFSTLGAFAVVDSSSPLTVEEPVVAGTFSVYPNPSNDFLNVKLFNPDHNMFQYELFDASGRKVMGTANSNEVNQFDLQNYERGSYTMRVTNLSTNEVITRLVIKS